MTPLAGGSLAAFAVMEDLFGAGPTMTPVTSDVSKKILL
jgi:hypothetical protein